MKFINLQSSLGQTVRWEETEEGFLRCPIRVLRSCVMPYALSELEEPPPGAPDPVMMFVDMDSMTAPDSLRSLEGVPIVTWDHMWATLDGVRTVSKGNVAGSPRVNGPYIETDVLATDAQAIQDIKDRKIGEVSAAYTAKAVFEPGVFDGVPYDARQTNIRYNHIAIIPEGAGRAGVDVRILNKSKEGEGESMDKVIKVKLRNGKYVNTDEEGAAAIESDNKESDAKEAGSGKKLEDSMSELEGKKSDMASLQAEIEELQGELSVYKEKLAQLLSEETIEGAASEMNEEQGQAGEILENAATVDEKGKEEDKEKKVEFKNSLKKLHGPKLYKAVLSKIGVKCENMSPEAMRGAFHAQHQILKSTGGKRFVAGTKIMNANGTIQVDVTQKPARTAHQRLGVTIPAKS